jgi:hypothetical protein
MASKNYYVVEFRLPHRVSEASSPEEAATKAAQYFRHQFGVDVSLWFTRVFEYGGGPEDIGPIGEWFSNPQGTKFRKIDQNYSNHQELFEKGVDPNES